MPQFIKLGVSQATVITK